MEHFRGVHAGAKGMHWSASPPMCGWKNQNMLLTAAAATGLPRRHLLS